MRWMNFLLVLLLFLCGCEGSTRHTVTTGTQGSLEGLRFYPPDHSRGVETETDPEIFWLPSYFPPYRFTVWLKRIDEYGNLHSVTTDLEQISNYRWKLKVSGTLNGGTLYTIIVRDEIHDEQKESWFLTGKTRRSHQPPSEPEGGGHTVVVEPKNLPK